MALSGEELIRRRADPNNPRKLRVRERTEMGLAEYPLQLRNAVTDIVPPEAFKLKPADILGVGAVSKRLIDCLRDRLFSNATVHRNVGQRTYDDRLYDFLKALMQCIEFANKVNYKPTEDEKLAFVEAVNGATKLLRDMYGLAV
jgi:hypothetical protein